MNTCNTDSQYNPKHIRTISSKRQACHAYDQEPHNIKHYPVYIGYRRKPSSEACITVPTKKNAPSIPVQQFSRYFLDIWASRSLVCKHPFDAYCKCLKRVPTVKISVHAFKFQTGVHKSIGKCITRLPLPNKTFLGFQTNVVPINIPFLIGIDLFKWFSLQLYSPNNTLYNSSKKRELPPIFMNGNKYIRTTENPNTSNFTKLRIHRHFTHHKAGTLLKLLKRAFPLRTNKTYQINTI